MWPRGGLWRDGAFLRLWAGQAISELGSRVTVLALPLGAILVLHASAFQVALLRTLEVAPLLLFALPAGVWIDRVRRRPLMIAADVVSALALPSIPLAYWTGTLSLAEVYAVAFVVGALAVVFDVAYLSFLPSLLPPERLADGNAKLQATRSATESAGPAVAGVLVGLFTAPVAILADAVSFAASALLVGSIRRPEERVEVERRRLGTELAEGVRYVFAQPYLRTLTTWSAGWSFFNSGFLALMVVYLVRGLGLSATTVGWILGLGSLGGVLGALVSARVVARFGIGPTIAASGVLSALGIFGLPRAPRAFPHPVGIAGQIVATGFGILFNLNHLTLRLAITPARIAARRDRRPPREHLRGRVAYVRRLPAVARRQPARRRLDRPAAAASGADRGRHRPRSRACVGAGGRSARLAHGVAAVRRRLSRRLRHRVLRRRVPVLRPVARRSRPADRGELEARAVAVGGAARRSGRRRRARGRAHSALRDSRGRGLVCRLRAPARRDPPRGARAGAGDDEGALGAP